MTKNKTLTLTDDEERIVCEALRILAEICRLNIQNAATGNDQVYVRAQRFMADTARNVRTRILGAQ